MPDAHPPPFRTVCVVGTGMIGASVGLAARRMGCRVIGVDSSVDQARAALECGAVDEVADSVPPAELVVIAVPVQHAAAVVRAVAETAAVITDALSTKRTIYRLAAETGLRGRFVAAHPMAGRAESGPGAAAADLFEDRPCFVFPSGDAANSTRVADFWRRLGGARPMRVRDDLTPAAHDALVARISHLPHAVAGALIRLASDDLEQAGPGLRDSTRVARGDPDLWTPLLLDNADRVAPLLRAMGASLEELAATLERGDAPALRERLDEARRRREALG